MNGVPLWQLPPSEGTPVNWCCTSADTLTAQLCACEAMFQEGMPSSAAVCCSVHSVRTQDAVRRLGNTSEGLTFWTEDLTQLQDVRNFKDEPAQKQM